MLPSQPSPAASRDGDIGAGWYIGALALYIVGGYFFQSVLLNWIVGPLFLLIVLYVIPTAARAIIRNVRKQPEP